MKKYILISALSLWLFVLPVFSQKPESNKNMLSSEEIENYKLQVSNMVTYFEGTLNFLGDPASAPREKEVIINKSYLKSFVDDKVQVEDDLDENREVPIHKDVQAYLKDVMFFFRKVSFQFIVVEVNHSVKENGDHYFTATFNRNLEGITIDGDTVKSRRVRYMEVNLDVGKSDMRIASIYSTKLNQREEMRNWWNGLNPAWRKALASDIVICDTIKLADVVFIRDSLLLISKSRQTEINDSTSQYVLDLPEDKRISTGNITDSIYINTNKIYTPLSGLLKQKKLNLEGNQSIRSLEPLSELSELTDVDISNTMVTNLFPLRNLNKLSILDVSNTPVEDLSAIRYNTSIQQLNCSFTLIQKLDAIGGLYNLIHLDCSGIRTSDFQFLALLPELQQLNCSETQLQKIDVLSKLTKLENVDISGSLVSNLKALESLSKIKYLNCDNTAVQSVEPISKIQSLEVLKISHTQVDSISSMTGLPGLTRIYWDGDEVLTTTQKKTAAINFMKENPGTLVIFESDELIKGWNHLEAPWKDKLKGLTGLGDAPTKEELHGLLKIEEIDMENTGITTLNPVRQLYNLRSLNISGVKVDDFSQLSDALEMEELNVSGTSIKGLEVLKSLDKLEILRIENTEVSSLSPLEGKIHLKFVYADGSNITDQEAFKFTANTLACIVVFKSEEMAQWWSELPDAWKDYFSASFKLSSPPSTEQLHGILFLNQLEILDRSGIKSLEPIKIMQGLKTMRLKSLPLSDITALSLLVNLEQLECTQMPLSDLSPLEGLKKITELNIENTTVSDLKSIAGLDNIKKLKISGSQVKSLKSIASFAKLEEIELNNTPVKSIKQLLPFAQLKSVECYNTKISAKTIESFKEDKPGCNVVYY